MTERERLVRRFFTEAELEEIRRADYEMSHPKRKPQKEPPEPKKRGRQPGPVPQRIDGKYNPAYYQLHRDEILRRQKEYRQAHPEANREACRRWVAKNPDKIAAKYERARQRRAKEKEAQQ